MDFKEYLNLKARYLENRINRIKCVFEVRAKLRLRRNGKAFS